MRAREQASAALGEMMNTAGGTIDDEWMTLTRSGLMPLCAGFLPCCDQVSRGWRFANFSSLLCIFPHSSAYIIADPRECSGCCKCFHPLSYALSHVRYESFQSSGWLRRTCLRCASSAVNLHEIDELGLTNTYKIFPSSS